MSLETSYEVLEMTRDEGVQTFRAKERATGRALELHLFPPFGRPENKTLYERMKGLPLETRRKFLDMGVDGSTPYVVTDPLPAGRSFKTWVDELVNTGRVVTAPVLAETPSRDDGVQILQAGQWRTGTPIPDSLISRPPAPPPKPLAGSIAMGDLTMVMKAPFEFPLSAAVPSAQSPPDPIAPEKPVSAQPGEFTGLFQAGPAKGGLATPPPPPLGSPVGEFTGLFQGTGSHNFPPPQHAKEQLPQFPPGPPLAPQTPVAPLFDSGIFQQPVAGKQDAGEFTRMFQGGPASTAASLPPPTPPPVVQPPFGQPVEKQESTEFTKYFENPLKPMSSPSQPAAFEPPPPPPPAPHVNKGSEFTEIFGKGPAGAGTGGFGSMPIQQAPMAPPPQGGFSATGVSQPGAWSQPQAPPVFQAGPSEYTRMMAAPSIPTLGQTPVAPPPAQQFAPPAATIQKKSNLPIIIAIGVAVLLVILIAAIVLMRSNATGTSGNPPASTAPAAK